MTETEMRKIEYVWLYLLGYDVESLTFSKLLIGIQRTHWDHTKILLSRWSNLRGFKMCCLYDSESRLLSLLKYTMGHSLLSACFLDFDEKPLIILIFLKFHTGSIYIQLHYVFLRGAGHILTGIWYPRHTLPRCHRRTTVLPPQP